MTDISVPDLIRAAGLATLGDNPSPEAVEAGVRKLAVSLNGADPTRRATVEVAARQVVPRGYGRIVDAAFRQSDGESGAADGPRRMTLEDPEPWPEPVGGAELLDGLASAFRRFIALPDGAADALALWSLFAHAHDAFSISPLMALTSPEKRCGKTTTLHVLTALVPRPLPASNITPAALFRAVESLRPTLLVDEADAFLREREELRGVLNSGHSRAGAVVVRAVPAGDDYEAVTFSTWAPKAIALIGDLPSTLEDRALMIPMRRRAPGEDVDRLRLDRLDELEPLRRMAARWTADHADELREADPAVPDGLHDRAADNWRPLLAVADAAGGEWPAAARAAAVQLSGSADDGDAPAVMLLEDLREMFEDRQTDELPSATIVEELEKREDRPWPEWRRGNPITPRQLARLLAPFNVFPIRIRDDGRQVRGYRLDAALSDAFTRYLTADPSQCHTPHNDAPDAGSGVRHKPARVTGEEKPNRAGMAPGVTGVTVGKGGAGKNKESTCPDCGTDVGRPGIKCVACEYGTGGTG